MEDKKKEEELKYEIVYEYILECSAPNNHAKITAIAAGSYGGRGGLMMYPVFV